MARQLHGKSESSEGQFSYMANLKVKMVNLGKLVALEIEVKLWDICQISG